MAEDVDSLDDKLDQLAKDHAGFVGRMEAHVEGLLNAVNLQGQMFAQQVRESEERVTHRVDKLDKRINGTITANAEGLARVERKVDAEIVGTNARLQGIAEGRREAGLPSSPIPAPVAIVPDHQPTPADGTWDRRLVLFLGGAATFLAGLGAFLHQIGVA